jgi:hypothetical protein
VQAIDGHQGCRFFLGDGTDGKCHTKDKEQCSVEDVHVYSPSERVAIVKLYTGQWQYCVQARVINPVGLLLAGHKVLPGFHLWGCDIACSECNRQQGYRNVANGNHLPAVVFQ